jgi:hypothetical protein
MKWYGAVMVLSFRRVVIALDSEHHHNFRFPRRGEGSKSDAERNLIDALDF